MRGAIAFLFVALSLTAADLAPTGTLRATFLGNNPVQGVVDPKTGVVTGVVADVTKELARKLGVPYVITPASGAPAIMSMLESHQADIGYLTYDPARAPRVDFAGAFALMGNTYLVPADSPIQKAADADRPGFKIGVVRGLTQNLFLNANIKNGQVKAIDPEPPPAELERQLISGELQAFAANRAHIEELAAASPKLRAVTDDFLVLRQGIVVVKGGDPAKLAQIDALIDEMLKSGFIKAHARTRQFARRW